MNANKVAALTGLSRRALHHYDALGLLSPARNENGYRDYSDEDLDRLQQILFFKECGFPLGQIQSMMQSPSFDRASAFELQRKYLLHERARVDAMLATLERSLKSLKGELAMKHEEKFAGFDFSSNPYEEEARKLYGNNAVDGYNQKLGSLSEKGRKDLGESMNGLFRELAQKRGEAPDSPAAQEAAHKLYLFLNANFGQQYSLEAFEGLGKMYVADERFKKNIDQFGEGLSEFLSKAMSAYARDKRGLTAN